MIYSKKKDQILFFSNIILIVLFLVFPFYMWQGDTSNALLRNASYFLALICSSVMFVFELKNINKKILFYALIYLVFASSTLIFHILYINLGSQETSQSHLISTSYCWMGFMLGRFSFYRTNDLYYKIIIIIIWLANFYFIISKVNWELAQAIYGSDDSIFAGSYQYIGDVFALISILLVSQLIGGITNKKQLTKLEILLCFIFIVLSTFISFLNGSRASFFSLFLVFIIIIIRLVIVSFNLRKVFVSSFIFFLCFVALFSNLTSSLGINTNILSENRNLEMMTEGKSSSLDERTEMQETSIAELWLNPLIGNYTAVNLSNQNYGNYIHNVLGIWHYFGFIPFIAYILAVLECLNIFFKRVRFASISETIVYGGSLMFCIISILFFRLPISFFSMDIVFGMFSTFDRPKQN